MSLPVWTLPPVCWSARSRGSILHWIPDRPTSINVEPYIPNAVTAARLFPGRMRTESGCQRASGAA